MLHLSLCKHIAHSTYGWAIGYWVSYDSKLDCRFPSSVLCPLLSRQQSNRERALLEAERLGFNPRDRALLLPDLARAECGVAVGQVRLLDC